MFLAIAFLVLMILWAADGAATPAQPGTLRYRGGFVIPLVCVAILGYEIFKNAFK